MLKQVTEEENLAIANDKFSKKAFGFWKRFQMFDKHPPWGWYDNDKLVAICHITSSKKTKYLNLYYIQSLEKGKGYGQILFDSLMKMYKKQGFERIKLSSEPEALHFWCDKNHFYFWSYDKYLSLKADAPIFETERERWVHREMVNMYPEKFIPPITKHLIHPKLTDKQYAKLIGNISKVGKYKYFDVIKQNDLNKWISA